VVRITSPTFIGRSAELAMLDEALEAAAQGHTTTVLIGGDAGVGKTRLLQTWNEHARERGANVVTGSCLDLGESGPGYTAIVEALRELIEGLGSDDINELLGPDRSILSRVVPEVATDGNEREFLQPLAQTRVFDRIVDLFDRASRRSPLVLHLEDLHWADPSTRAFIVYLVEMSKTANLLITGTYRAEETGRDHPFSAVLEQVLRRPGVLNLQLSPFDRDETREQLVGILGRPPSNALLDAVVQRSEGNALFTEELIAIGDIDADLPRSIAKALAARSAGMPPTAGTILRVASVAGRTVSYGVLRASMALPEDELADALRSVVRANIMEPSHAGEGYRFRHALLQEAIYQDTLPGERRRLHAIVAQALEGGADQSIDQLDLPSLLAHHWHEAREFDHALAASIDAGDLAARRSAHREALQHFERAVELWNRVPEAQVQARMGLADLLQRATREASLAGEPGRAVALGRQGLAQLDIHGDPALRARVLDDLSFSLDQLTKEDEAEALELELADMDTATLPAVEQMLVLDARSRLFRFKHGDHAAARTAADEMLAVARTTGDEDLVAQAQLAVGCSLGDMQDFDGAIERAGFASELAMRAGDAELVCRAQREVFEALWQTRSYESAIATAREAQRYADRVGLGRSVGPRAAVIEADSLRALGRLSESAEVVEAALLNDPVGISLLALHTLAAELAINLGSLDDAADHLAAARAPDVTYPRGFFATISAEFAIAEGRADDARDIASATSRRLSAHRPFTGDSEDLWWLVEVGLAAEAERAENARAANDEAARLEASAAGNTLIGYLDDVRRLREKTGIPDIGKHRGREALIDGHLARIEGRDDPSLWSAAAAEFPPVSVEALSSRYRQAEAMLAAKAPRDEVGAVMVDAHAAAVDIGARPIADRFEALARRARIDLNPAPSAHASDNEMPVPDEIHEPGSDALRKRGLSDREIEVLTLVASGFSNRQIGDRLFITAKTASVHMSHIRDKLEASSRTDAATIGARLGLPDVSVEDGGPR
jgi:DNA-binding NarL/FixJ family response regulator/tetratricopeptide (TPR) repeat protein